MTTAMSARSTWWGSYEIPVGTCGGWTVGPLSLWVERLEGEWRVAYKTTEDHLDPTIRVQVPVEGVDLMELDKVTRFAVTGADPVVHVTPVLADRPFISRPEKPFVVLPQDEITVYISTPVWLRIEVGEPRRQLLEVPTVRPSDTWFGPDTMQGELCYAARAAMRLNLEQVPLRAHRAITAIQVRNRGLEVLTVDRLNLPVVYLSLFQGADDELWTENVVFERPAGSDEFQLRLRESAGRGSKEGAVEVGAPRQVLPDRVSVRALASLFH
ncbi:MAG: hypothetical protein ABI333_16560 [bacterium]